MKQILLFFCIAFQMTVFGQIDGGIVNPADGLIISKYNRANNFPSGDIDEMQIDGWSNTGDISSIKIYQMLGSSPNTSNDVFLGNALNANSGSWYRDIDVDPGTSRLYINVRCNYAGCAQAGINSEPRTITYVRPYERGDFYLDLTSDNNVEITILEDYGIGGLNTGFYYRVYRHTEPVPSGGTYIGDIDEAGVVVDNNTLGGETYYYWVEAYLDSSGTHPSGFVDSEYRTINTLSTNDVNSNVVSVYPNPSNGTIHVASPYLKAQGNWSLYNTIGQKIVSNTYENNADALSLELPNINHGVYVLQIETEKGIYRKQIVRIK